MTTIRTADGSHTLHSERYGETFHSINGAVTESRHVFLNASGVAERLATGQATRVLEIGFGLGLNCLLTADMASDHGAALDYHAIENDPSVLSLLPTVHYKELLNDPGLFEMLMDGLNSIVPSSSDSIMPLSDSLGPLPDSMKPLTDSILPLPDSIMPLPDSIVLSPDSIMPSPDTTRTAGELAPLSLSKNITLKLHLCDATRNELPTGPFDAIYLDAFSPDSNPECWSPEFLSRLHGKTASHGALTTYSAKGSVRRALMAAGYRVKKMAGPPGKREMLHAEC